MKKIFLIPLIVIIVACGAATVDSDSKKKTLEPGTLIIGVENADDVSVYIDDEIVGTAGTESYLSVELPAGRHSLKLSHPDFVEYSESVLILMDSIFEKSVFLDLDINTFSSSAFMDQKYIKGLPEPPENFNPKGYDPQNYFIFCYKDMTPVYNFDQEYNLIKVSQIDERFASLPFNRFFPVGGSKLLPVTLDDELNGYVKLDDVLVIAYNSKVDNMFYEESSLYLRDGVINYKKGHKPVSFIDMQAQDKGGRVSDFWSFIPREGRQYYVPQELPGEEGEKLARAIYFRDLDYIKNAEVDKQFLADNYSNSFGSMYGANSVMYAFLKNDMELAQLLLNKGFFPERIKLDDGRGEDSNLSSLISKISWEALDIMFSYQKNANPHNFTIKDLEYPELVNILLKHNIDLKFEWFYHYLPFGHKAARNYHNYLSYLFLNGYETVTETALRNILKLGVDVNYVNRCFYHPETPLYTALDLAIEHNYSDSIIAILREAGAKTYRELYDENILPQYIYLKMAYSGTVSFFEKPSRDSESIRFDLENTSLLIFDSSRFPDEYKNQDAFNEYFYTSDEKWLYCKYEEHIGWMPYSSELTEKVLFLKRNDNPDYVNTVLNQETLIDAVLDNNTELISYLFENGVYFNNNELKENENTVFSQLIGRCDWETIDHLLLLSSQYSNFMLNHIQPGKVDVAIFKNPELFKLLKKHDFDFLHIHPYNYYGFGQYPYIKANYINKMLACEPEITPEFYINYIAAVEDVDVNSVISNFSNGRNGTPLLFGRCTILDISNSDGYDNQIRQLLLENGAKTYKQLVSEGIEPQSGALSIRTKAFKMYEAPDVKSSNVMLNAKEDTNLTVFSPDYLPYENSSAAVWGIETEDQDLWLYCEYEGSKGWVLMGDLYEN